MTRQRFNALHMPLEGIRLIEASAGTGKTYSLAGLYLRLLVEKQLQVKQILVMTFTRAATQELRERIRQRLQGAAQIAARTDGVGNGPEEQFALAMLARSDEEPAALAQRLAQAARSMDEAVITTIHGFSQRAASEHAFASGLAFDRGEQVDDERLYAEAAGDYWRKQALGTHARPGFTQLWPGPDELNQDLRTLREQAQASIAGPDAASIEQHAAEIRERWPQEAAAFRQAWEDMEKDNGLYKGKAIQKAISQCGGMAAAMDQLEHQLNSKDRVPLLPAWLGTLVLDGQFKKAQARRGAAMQAEPLLMGLVELQGLGRLWEFRRARQQIETWVEQRKAQRRQYSFADMIKGMHRAISDPERSTQIADALQQDWPWALVDEFQDTDPQQYDILRRIYAGRDYGGLFLIGDPKQAIYGFRGGDVFSYLQAARDAGAQCYSLDTNYRSSSQLLTAIDALFRCPASATFLIDGIEFQSVDSGLTDQTRLQLGGDTQAALQLWALAPDSPGKALAEQACGAACVAQVQLLLGGSAQFITENRETERSKLRPVEAGDIAILVNNNAQASHLQRALSAAGIASVCQHQDSVFASPEASELLQVLRAAAAPSDEALLRGALSTHLLGARQSDVIALIQDESAWRKRCEQMQHAQEVWRRHGILAMLQELVQAAAPRLLSYRDGERRLSNYLQLAELLAQAQSQSFGQAGLINWLSRSTQQCLKQDSSEAEQLRLESDAALVRITTVHKAKGLEYHIVILPFAPWLGAAGQPGVPPQRFHDRQMRSQLDLVGSSFGASQAILEQRAEALRLLYVAVTRAAVACYLPWGAANGTPNSALASLLHRPNIAPDFWASARSSAPLTTELCQQTLQKLVAEHPECIASGPLPETFSPPPSPTPSCIDDGQARTDLPRPRAPWSLHSFSRLLRQTLPDAVDDRAGDESGQAPVADLPDQERLTELPGGTHYGNAVHQLLEQNVADELSVEGAVPRRVQVAILGALRSQGIMLNDAKEQMRVIDGTANLLRAAWYTDLPAIGALADLPRPQRIAEMEFHFRLGGESLGAVLSLLQKAGYVQDLPAHRQQQSLLGLMHGYIDLVAAREGRYYVIDYKTNWLGPNRAHYGSEGMRKAIRHHHYDLQYLIYLTALHRHLRRRLPHYAADEHLGGALYLFLRGMTPGDPASGLHFDHVNIQLIQDLDRLLDAEAAQA